MIKRLLWAVLAALVLLCGCTRSAPELQDGYYTAESSTYDAWGWKQYLTIYVRDGRILTVEYNAKNTSGFLKSWDMGYMRAMREVTGTYPSDYGRTYTVSLLNRQDPAAVDAVSGATRSHSGFRQLAEAALNQAREGNPEVVLVALAGSSEIQ